MTRQAVMLSWRKWRMMIEGKVSYQDRTYVIDDYRRVKKGINILLRMTKLRA